MTSKTNGTSNGGDEGVPHLTTEERLAILVGLAETEPLEYPFAALAVAKQLRISRRDLDTLIKYVKGPKGLIGRKRVNGGGAISGTTEDAAHLVEKATLPESADPASDLPEAASKLANLFSRKDYLLDRVGPVKIVHPVDGSVPEAMPLTPDAVVNEAHRHCRPILLKASGEQVEVTLSDRVAKLYLGRLGEWKLRPFNGMTTTPLLDEQGGHLDSRRLRRRERPMVPQHSVPGTSGSAELGGRQESAKNPQDSVSHVSVHGQRSVAQLRAWGRRDRLGASPRT